MVTLSHSTQKIERGEAKHRTIYSPPGDGYWRRRGAEGTQALVVTTTTITPTI